MTLWPCIISLVMLCNEHIMSSRGDVVSISRAFQTNRDVAAVNYLLTPRLWYASVNSVVCGPLVSWCCVRPPLSSPLSLSLSPTQEKQAWKGALWWLHSLPLRWQSLDSLLCFLSFLFSPPFKYKTKSAISSITK